uniref:Uncharacterized protein n=1 Tax=Oryza punctata TaxID=4537 RepID=A0A0E0LBQ5_ORYPU
MYPCLLLQRNAKPELSNSLGRQLVASCGILDDNQELRHWIERLTVELEHDATRLRTLLSGTSSTPLENGDMGAKGMGTWLFLFFSDGADGIETCGWSRGDTNHWL